jgi:hypothetical protein
MTFRIFGERIEIGAGTSGIIMDEIIVGQQLRDFWWKKGEWVSRFVIFGGRSESGAGSSEILVDKVRMWQAIFNFWLTK